VIAKPSSDMFKGTNKPLSEIGSALGVDGLVTGSVMRSGNRVQIAAQLVKADSGAILWANRYERDAGDVLALQSELVTAIAREVRATISPEQSARLASRRQVDPAAHDAYLRGRSFFAQMAGAGPDRRFMDGAIGEFEKSIRLDPAYAAPQAALANMYLTVSQTSTIPPSEVAGKAKAAARKAVDLDDGLAEAHAALGGVLLWLEWDWAGAEREITRALTLNPDSVDALIASEVHALLVHNRTEDAEVASQRILNLDPLNPFSRVQRVWVAVLSRRFDEAIRRAQALEDVWPGNIMSPFFSAQAYAMQHKPSETSAACGKVIAATTGAFSMQTTALCVWALGSVGQTAEARRLLQTLEHPPAGVWLDPAMMVSAYGGLGNLDRALEWCQKGIDERVPNMIYAKVGPAYDFARGDARFQALLERMNFPR
jgi:tetratricopeptide (TPR) repeat protein